MCCHTIADLVERVGGLGAEADWAHMLSLGEQQRVAWLRLLLHAPALAFLDEVRMTSENNIQMNASIPHRKLVRCLML